MTKVKIENYDEYLMTERNMTTFTDALEAQDYYGKIYIYDDKLIIDFGDHLITKEIMRYCADFWEGQARIEFECSPEQQMWNLCEAMDDIDASDEIAGSDDVKYRVLVKAVVERIRGE